MSACSGWVSSTRSRTSTSGPSSGSPLVGANTRNYLLEKQRVTHPPENERGYHIYYMLLTSAPECAARKLGKVRPPQGPLPPRHASARAPYTLLTLADPFPRRFR